MSGNNETSTTTVLPSESSSAALSHVKACADNEIVISRVMNAPRERVFDMWLKQEHLAHWFGPEGFSITTHEIDVRTGGVWHFTMHGTDGTDYGNHIEYTEVTRPERIAYRQSGEGSTAAIRFESVATFIDLGGKTELVLKSTFPSAAERNVVVEKYGAIDGGKQTLGRLAQYVEAGG